MDGAMEENKSAQGGKTAEEKESEIKLRKEERRKNKLARAADPRSIAIAATMAEVEAMLKVLLNCDRILNTLKRGAGTFIAVDVVRQQVNLVEGIIHKLEVFIARINTMYVPNNGSFGEVMESMEVKMNLAQRDRSWVLIPRGDESRKIVLLLKVLDNTLLNFKTTCPIDAVEVNVGIIIEIAREFYQITEGMAKITREETRYKRPWRVGKQV